jgi:hypothetical protein
MAREACASRAAAARLGLAQSAKVPAGAARYCLFAFKSTIGDLGNIMKSLHNIE